MIVICDFLLLSLLSLANFDKPKVEDKQEAEKKQALEQQSFADSQMLDLLKMSLDSERDRRIAMDSDVAKLEKIAEENKKLAERQKKILDARENELKLLAKTKSDLETEREQILKKSGELQSRVSQAEKRNIRLQEEIISASAKLEKSASERIALEKKIGDMKEIDSASRIKLEAVQNELRQNKERLEQLRTESESLKSENKAIEAEKQALATRLEVASTKTQIYEENIKRYQALVDIEKTEKAKIREHAETLAVGVNQLAEQQQKLNNNVKDLRPKTSSEVFELVKAKFIKIIFAYTRQGLFGNSESFIELRSLPVEIGGKYWLLFDASDTIIAPTPHQYYPPDSLSISVQGKAYRFQPSSISSLAEDPRMLAIEIPKDFIEKEKIEPIVRPENFFAYSDCVVINPSKFYYGQIPFRADFKNPTYAKLDVGLIQSVFGEFSPSAGDVVITRSGNVIGCMIDGSIALLYKTITPLDVLPLGNNYDKKHTAQFVKVNSEKLKQLPLRLK